MHHPLPKRSVSGSENGERRAASAVWRGAVWLLLSLLPGLVGCGEETGPPNPNQPPETTITSSVPANGESVHHMLTIFYSFGDIDGTVRSYEYLVHIYPPSVSSLDEIVVPTPPDDDPRWTKIDVSSVDLVLTADVLRPDSTGGIGDGRQDRWHTFFVRAIDNEGAKDPTPDSRTFNAYTTAPFMTLLEPVVPGQAVDLPVTFALHWDGFDDGINGAIRNPLEARWALVPVTLDAADQPIDFPDSPDDLPDSLWSTWFAFAPPDTSGIEARFRDVIMSRGDSTFVFALQGRDDAGAATPQFKSEPFGENNVTVVKVHSDIRPGPGLVLQETLNSLGPWTFEGAGLSPVQVSVNADSVAVTWGTMTTSSYGGRSGDYRFGWNDSGWSEWGRRVFDAPAHALTNPTEKFDLQARDNLGQITTATLLFRRP